jgi:hypothetical protein
MKTGSEGRPPSLESAMKNVEKASARENVEYLWVGDKKNNIKSSTG